jgi:phage gpG-like protein
MVVKIDITGIEGTKKYLKSKMNNIKSQEKTGLNNATIFLQGEVKLSIAGHRAEPTSVDTGRFLNSIDFNVGDSDAIVFTDIEYSKFLEYGTSRMIPRMHFRNTKSRNQGNIQKIINESIKGI